MKTRNTIIAILAVILLILGGYGLYLSKNDNNLNNKNRINNGTNNEADNQVNNENNNQPENNNSTSENKLCYQKIDDSDDTRYDDVILYLENDFDIYKDYLKFDNSLVNDECGFETSFQNNIIRLKKEKLILDVESKRNNTKVDIKSMHLTDSCCGDGSDSDLFYLDSKNSLYVVKNFTLNNGFYVKEYEEAEDEEYKIENHYGINSNIEKSYLNKSIKISDGVESISYLDCMTYEHRIDGTTGCNNDMIIFKKKEDGKLYRVSKGGEEIKELKYYQYIKLYLLYKDYNTPDSYYYLPYSLRLVYKDNKDLYSDEKYIKLVDKNNNLIIAKGAFQGTIPSCDNKSSDEVLFVLGNDNKLYYYPKGIVNEKGKATLYSNSDISKIDDNSNFIIITFDNGEVIKIKSNSGIYNEETKEGY